jgi:hypothetical protein
MTSPLCANPAVANHNSPINNGDDLWKLMNDAMMISNPLITANRQVEAGGKTCGSTFEGLNATVLQFQRTASPRLGLFPVFRPNAACLPEAPLLLNYPHHPSRTQPYPADHD